MHKGFTTTFYNRKITEVNCNEFIEIEKITDVNKFIEIRKSLLPENSLNLCSEALEFVLEQYEVYTNKGDLKRNLAVFYVENDIANIRELLSNEDSGKFISAILNLTGCNQFTVLAPSANIDERSGMIYPPDGNLNYLGLALD